jgi:hypothetical protein
MLQNGEIRKSGKIDFETASQKLISVRETKSF